MAGMTSFWKTLTALKFPMVVAYYSLKERCDKSIFIESLTWCSVSHEKLTKLAGHSVVVLGDNVVIFGGMTDNETLTNNTIVFNYKELVEVHRYD